MPPKRKSTAATASSSKQPAKRRSKLAKDNDITADQEAEIQESFALFSTKDGNMTGQIAASDVRRCLIALNAPPASNDELQELLEIADPEITGWISYDFFLPVAALQINRACDSGDDDARHEEIDKAYLLFTQGEERPITISDLKRISKELKEDIPDNVLKDMIREATAGSLGGVGKDDFEGVMRRAGVFG